MPATRVLVIPANPTIAVHAATIDGLESMQALVEGYIEAVDNTDGTWTMWLNEEGKIEGLPHNPRATNLVTNALFPNDYIAGNAFITGPPNNNGDTTSLTDTQITTLTTACPTTRVAPPTTDERLTAATIWDNLD